MIAVKSKVVLEKLITGFPANKSFEASKSNNPVESNYYLLRKEQYESNADCFVNLSKILYDRKIECLGSSKETGKINWDSIFEMVQFQHKRESQMSAKLASQTELWRSFSQWMECLLESRDAQSVDGKRQVKSRVESLYFTLLKAPEDGQMKLLKVIAKSSENCGDMAVVGLEEAEMTALLVTLGEDKMINILVLAFKKQLIKAMLMPASPEKSVETYLYYSILLNDALMLKNQNLSMLYPGIAVKCPVDEAIKRIFGKLTLEDLVCFISNNKYFRKAALKEEYPNKASYLENCERINSERAMILDDDLKSELLKDEYDKISDDFYKPIAHDVLMKKGFITQNVRYSDPISFPRINLLASSEEPNGIASFELEDIRHWTFVRDLIFVILAIVGNLLIYGVKVLLTNRTFFNS